MANGSFPKEFYGFTSFATPLNGDLVGKLPPTDSRYRPDVRASEESNIDRAEEEKQRVEELQRQQRRIGWSKCCWAVAYGFTMNH